MIKSFITAVNAVLPFVIYLLFGYGVKRSGIVDEAFLKKLNRMVFRCFFPVMMFKNLYHISPGSRVNGFYVTFSVASLLVLIVLLVLLLPRFVSGDPQRGVMIQGIFRSNFVLFALPMTESVFQEAGVAVASVLVAIIVPIYNVAAVIILEMFNPETKGKASRRPGGYALLLFKNVLTNPIILGAIVGALFLLFGIRLPEAVDQPVSAISNMTTPLALFILGGTLRFSTVGRNGRYLAPVLLIKMILLPLFTTLAAPLLPITNIEQFVLLVMYGSPTAVASYAMAENMGGDGELAGQIVALGTVLSIFTLFGWIFLYGQMGLL